MNKILVVDDNINNLRLLKDILEDEDFIIYTLSDSTLVVDFVKREYPDLILLDVMMPVIDGFELCKLLQTDDSTKDIPIIMVTARTESMYIKEGLGLGAVDYIRKPIDEIEVIARVQTALKLKKKQDELKELAIRDGLTRLFNQSYLIELLNTEIEKHIQSNEPMAFVMLDIDFFKKVNDTYGHLVGDSILQQLSGILTKSLRIGDFVGRYGGEEFSLILRNSNLENAYTFCEALREKINQHVFHVNQHAIQLTVSMGVTCKMSYEQTSHSEVINKADTMLYKAKQNGRNKVEKDI